MTLIFKICDAGTWAKAEQEGMFHGAAVDLADGYIHFSTAGQVAETAARHFAAQQNLVLAAVDSEILGVNLEWEPARGGALFPHLYAPLPMSAVRWTKPLPLGANGRHVLPDLG